MPVLSIPTPLMPYTEGKNEVIVSGTTAGEAVTDLTLRFPTIRPHLFNEEGGLRSFVNLFKGEENVNDLLGLNTLLNEQDRLMIIPSIAGG